LRNVRRHKQRATPGHGTIDDYRNTREGDAFLRVQEADILIFAAQVDLDFLCECRHWFADGTFRVTPQGFDQLYTIHGFLGHKTYPCVYALLPGRSEDIYTRLLDIVIAMANRANPVSVVTDFELAAIKAFQSKFPTASISGCMFHFGQCIWRRLQADGLSSQYNSNPDFSILVRRLLALAFVPETEVIGAYEMLTDLPEYRQLDTVIDYFEDNFIGRARRGRRNAPRFPISMWNLYERVLTKLPRSNNAVEGWHHAFNNSVVIAHPTPGRLARKLHEEQHAMIISRRQAELGQPAAKKRKKYQRIDDALFTMVSDYRNREQMQYLSDIGRVLNIDVAN
jgi:hypothetical protein